MLDEIYFQYQVYFISLLNLRAITTVFTTTLMTIPPTATITCKCILDSWWRSWVRWFGMWVSRVWSMSSMRMRCRVVLIAFKPITANIICSSSDSLAKGCHGRSHKFFDGSITFIDFFFSEFKFRIFTESFSFKSCDPTFNSISMIIGICRSSYISSACITMKSWNSPVIII